MKLFWLCIAVFALFAAPVEARQQKAKTRPVGSKPLTDHEAAKRVRRTGYEPTPGNREENRRILTRKQLRYFRRHGDSSYSDGRERWLNTVERGREYAAGDIWGAAGGWFSGRWHTPPAQEYIADVRRIKRERTWREPFVRD